MAGRQAPANRFFRPDEEKRILDAIRRAEAETSGEIRVHVESTCPGAPLDVARQRFARLGMTATAARNGVLIYLATRDRRFAVLGDDGIHQEVGDVFWQELRDRMEARFRKDEFAQGLEEAILAIGEHLAAAFPRAADDRNELPDEISEAEDDTTKPQ